MKIIDIKANQISPFNIDDNKLIKLFSFFLHNAPTIDSATAANIEAIKLERNWNNFISAIGDKKYIILSKDYHLEKKLEEYSLNDEAEINRKHKGFVCNRKNKDESDYTCLLRHLRNAIAHSNVYMSNAGNRKYLIFEDFNRDKRRTAIILFSQSDLEKLKREILK